MSLLTNVLVMCALCVALYRADDLLVGNTANAQLAYQEVVKLSAIPLTVRTKNVLYNTNNTKTIKAISAVDLNKSKAKPTITGGGVNSTFVNVNIKSARGSGLNYLVQIFV